MTRHKETIYVQDIWSYDQKIYQKRLSYVCFYFGVLEHKNRVNKKKIDEDGLRFPAVYKNNVCL